MAHFFQTALIMGVVRPPQIEVPGNLTLGGLFPVHEQGNGTLPCGAIRKGRGIHRVLSMLFAIEKINNSTEILPGVRLGAKILDTCSHGNYALNMTMDFIQDIISEREVSSFECPSTGQIPVFHQRPVPLAGVVGASYSSVTTLVSQLLRIYQIAQISPASTTADLSDKLRYDFFARTVPSDQFQGMVLADILLRFNWSYVSLVYSESDYGRTGADNFKHAAAKRKICIAFEAKTSDNAGEDSYNVIMKQIVREARLNESTGSRVVVLFASNDQIRRLLKAARDVRAEKIQWVSSESWETLSDSIVRYNEKFAKGALVIAVKSHKIPEFEKFFRTSTQKYLSSDWIKEYWEAEFNCTFPNEGQVSGPSDCTGKEEITDKIVRGIDDKVEFVITAVYAMAHALHSLIRTKCPLRNGKMWLCPEIESGGKSALQDGKEFYKEHLMNVNFTAPDGLELFHFDEKGDAPPRYVIKNFRSPVSLRGKWTYEVIGEWDDEKLDLPPDTDVQFANGSSPSISACASDCGINQVKKIAGISCCWVCVSCKPRHRVQDQFNCEDCLEGQWPTQDFKSCYSIAAVRLETTNWLSVYSLIPCAIALCGLVATLAVVGIMLRFNSTPIVKASGRELSYTMLSGICLCYIMTFVIMAEPTAIICALRRLGIGLSFAILYSALLVKTNRIYRIFESAKRTPIRPKFIDPRSQLIITGFLVAIQLISGVIWLCIQFPGRYIDYPDPQPRAVLKCNTAGQWFLVSLIYDGILICVCTVYAVKTRQVPENFNEAKFIGFSMYTTCVIWLAFVPIYFGTGNDYKIQTTTLCVSISLSATATLFCLYLPKIYVIYYEPHRSSKSAGVPSLSRPADSSVLVTNPSVYSPLLQAEKEKQAAAVYMNNKVDIVRSSLTPHDDSIKRRSSSVQTSTDIDFDEPCYPLSPTTLSRERVIRNPLNLDRTDLDSLDSTIVD